MSDDVEQRRERAWEFFLKKIQGIVILFVGFYASILGIVSFNSDVKSLFTISGKIDKIEGKVDTFIKQSEETQKVTNSKINDIKELADKAHAPAFDHDGYRTITIRKANNESDLIDKNSVYYDPSSKFFPELKEDGGTQNFKVILKNNNNLFSPELVIKIREKTKKKNTSEETDITFQVSQSIFTTLGGGNNSIYLNVKAKIIPYNQ